MSLKFIHVADLHVGSPMRGLSVVDEVVSQRVRSATRTALENTINFAIAENVAFVVVAGDLFDESWDDLTTRLWTFNQLARLDEYGVPVFIAFGNHDRKRKALDSVKWPRNVRIFSWKAPETFVYPDVLTEIFGASTHLVSAEAPTERVAINGQSYASDTCSKNIAEKYPDATPGAFNVGVLHTDLSGDGSNSKYAPVGVDALNSKAYNYWALGHVHRRQTAQTRPCWIGFSGVLQGRDVQETGAKGFYVVEIENGVATTREPKFVEADAFRWFALEINLTGAETLEKFYEKFDAAIKKTLDEADGRFAAFRVTFVGRTPLHRELKRKRAEEKLDEMLRDRLSDRANEIWLEKVELETSAPRAETLGTVGAFGGLADDFERKIAEYAGLENAGETRVSEENADVAAFDDLKSALGSLKTLVAFDDPANLRRWNEEAREILIDAFDDGE